MSFDRLAPHYRWMEFVLAGDKLQRCRLAWLGEVRACRDVLIVGDGPGRFLQICARELPEARFTCVDASQAMLDRARAAWLRAGGNPGQARFIHAALPQWRPPVGSFDLIVTHFFLDCFPAAILAEVIANLAAAAKPGTRWLISDFQIPLAGLQRFRAKAVLALAYAFFRSVTRLQAKALVSPEPFLKRHGFELQHRRTFDWDLLRADAWVLEAKVHQAFAVAPATTFRRHGKLAASLDSGTQSLTTLPEQPE